MMPGVVAGFPAKPFVPYSLRGLVNITSGVDAGTYRWFYAVRVFAGSTQVASLTAQQLANLNPHLYYTANHWSGAHAALWPSPVEPIVEFETGLTVQKNWTHMIVDWGGDMKPGSAGYTSAHGGGVEKGRANWSGRNTSSSYANRFTDQVALS